MWAMCMQVCMQVHMYPCLQLAVRKYSVHKWVCMCVSILDMACTSGSVVVWGSGLCMRVRNQALQGVHEKVCAMTMSAMGLCMLCLWCCLGTGTVAECADTAYPF